jgi:hypothetical protein
MGKYYSKKINYQIIIFLLSFLFLSLPVFSQITHNWKWLHPKPQGNTLTQCKLWDFNTFYITGWYGTFMKTTDGGNTWLVNNEAEISI